MSGGHGVGASVVNALSRWLEVEICDGDVFYQRLNVAITGRYKIIRQGGKRGTTVRFRADDEIFHTVEYAIIF